jgi:hypothetical protein
MRKNEPEIEVLPSPAEIVRWRSGVDESELHRAVQEKVAEIMADRDAFVFEPFFRSRKIAYELKRLQTIPEQQKWSVYFERRGCLICQTRERIHIGCGMCQNCYPRIFRELTQIIAEGLTGEAARPASGASRTERLLPPHEPRNTVHRSWYERSNETDKLLYSRVAKQLGVSPVYVRCVARGQRHSEAVSAALKKEIERFSNGEKS